MAATPVEMAQAVTVDSATTQEPIATQANEADHTATTGSEPEQDDTTEAPATPANPVKKVRHLRKARRLRSRRSSTFASGRRRQSARLQRKPGSVSSLNVTSYITAHCRKARFPS